MLNYCVNPFDFSLETYLDLVLTQKNRTKLSFIQCTVHHPDERPTSGAASTLDPLPLKADRDQLPGGGQGHVGQAGGGQAQWGSCFCFRMQVDVDGSNKNYDEKVITFSHSLIAAGQHVQFL